MTVYIVVYGYYDDVKNEGVFSSREAAEAFIASRPKSWRGGLFIEEWDVLL